MLELFWWGRCSCSALPVMAALLVLGPRVLPEYRDPTPAGWTWSARRCRCVAMLAVVYGLKQIAAGRPSTPRPAPSIVAGLLVGVAWVRRQRRLADPMIDVGLFRVRAFNAALVVNFLAIFVMVGYFLFVAQYLQLVLGLSPLEAGLWSAAGRVGFVVGVAAGAAAGATRPRRPTLVGGGLAVAAAGLVLLTRVGADRRAARAGRRRRS